MQRHLRKPRYPFTNAGFFGMLTPIARAPVLPGETLKEISLRLTGQSVPIGYPLVGAYVDVHYWYVPFRLLDADFPEEIVAGTWNPSAQFAAANGKKSVYFTTTSGNSMLHDAVHHLGNLFYNPLTASDMSASTDLVAMRADMIAEMFSSEEVEGGPDVSIDVSGGTLSMEELFDSRREYLTNLKRAQLDDSYLTHLAQAGVDMKEGFISEPEFLWSQRKWIMPSKAVDQSTGNTVQSYFVSMEGKRQTRKYFPEHGLIVGLALIRPSFFDTAKKGTFDELHDDCWHENWFPGISKEFRVDTNTDWSPLADAKIDTSSPLYRGEALLGRGMDPDTGGGETTYVYGRDCDTVFKIRAGNCPGFTVSGNVLEDTCHYQLNGLGTFDIATPLPRPRDGDMFTKPR